MSKKYDFDFKESVIYYYREAKKVPNAKAFRDTIKRFGLNHQTLSRWIREFEDYPMLGPITGPDMSKQDKEFNDVHFQRIWKEVESAPAEVHVTEKWQENARDDYDHIEAWLYELTETDLRFLIKQCLAHARHAGGRSYLRLSHVISVLEGRIEKGVG